ncbi:helix-turn-helix domain-containing protein [Rubrivirga sp. IMCC45206]|uniref:helix-turn-helix domain-containing protein n=1 Tax=Rubrivirga sp. IMCC45206 TaxID=3391614 RepID=UPI0039900A7A
MTTDLRQTLRLDELSEALRISRQTLVRWTDRGLISADLDWGVSDQNVETRLIAVDQSTIEFLEGFAGEYREDTVSRTEARRLLKLIDRNQVQKLIRQGSIKARKIKGETRVSVGSVEDYLMTLEETE